VLLGLVLVGVIAAGLTATGWLVYNLGLTQGATEGRRLRPGFSS